MQPDAAGPAHPLVEFTTVQPERLYLKRQQHGTRACQTRVSGNGDAQIRRQGEDVRLHQEEGLRCHQKPPPQQGGYSWEFSARFF